jgi:hypothetical protein
MKITYIKLICISLLACFALLSVHAAGQQSPERSLAPNAWEGFLPIEQDGKWGYINRSGEVVIKPQFDSAQPFAEGLALVRYPARKKPPKPGEKTPELVEGMGFIDQTGKVVIELENPLHLNGESFSEGLTKYWTWDADKGNLYGYIDTSGKVRIKARFTYAWSFVDGLAAVCIEWQKCGFIDKTGEFVIAPKYRVNMSFSEGLALAGLEYDTIGFINKSGEMVIEPQFGNLVGTMFREGLSSVAYPHGRFGYINTEGAIVIPMQFEMAQPFSEGLAAVRINSKWGYIDKSGKFVIEPQFRGAGPFAEGLAPVGFSDSAMRPVEEEATGFIDKQGKMLISLRFDTASGFVNGIARVNVDSKWGYIDRTGKYIWQPSN